MRRLHTHAAPPAGRASISPSPTHSRELFAAMQYGIVKWFNDAKGFGSIALEDGSADISPPSIPMASAACRKANGSVEVQQGAKGAQAAGVKPA